MTRWVYIYALTCPDTGDVKYVGQSVNPSARYYQHVTSKSAEPCHIWIHRLKQDGKRPGFRIIERCERSVSNDIENFWIQHYHLSSSEITNRNYRDNKGAKRETAPEGMLVAVPLRIPVELDGKLKAIAHLELRSLNRQVVHMVATFVADYERRNGPVAVTPPDNAQAPG